MTVTTLPGVAPRRSAGDASRNVHSTQNSISGKRPAASDDVFRRAGKTLTRWGGLSSDTYALPTGKKILFSDLDDFELDVPDDSPDSTVETRVSESPPHSPKIEILTPDIPEVQTLVKEKDASCVRFVRPALVKEKKLLAQTTRQTMRSPTKRRRKRKYKTHDHGTQELTWDMGALFEEDGENSGGSVLESIVSIHLLQPSNYMDNGGLAQRINHVLRGQSSVNFMKISRVHAEMRNRIEQIVRHIGDVEALEEMQFATTMVDGYGGSSDQTPAESVNTTKHAEVALRMRQIRKVLQSLHWPTLHGDLRRWVRRSGETEQTMRDFLETTRTQEREIAQLLAWAKHQADLPLATRELLVANQMGKFHKKLTAVSDKFAEKRAQNQAVEEEAQKVKADSEKEAMAAREAHNKAERSKVLKLLSRKTADQQRVIRHAERSVGGPGEHSSDHGASPQKSSPVPANDFTRSAGVMNSMQKQGGIHRKSAEAAAGNLGAVDVELFDDGRYGHLKRIYTRHAEKISELTATIQKNELELIHLQEQIGSKLDEEQQMEHQKNQVGSRSASHTPHASATDKKAKGGNRFNGIVPPDMQHRLVLRRERDALCKYLNEVTCEDFASTAPNEPDVQVSAHANNSNAGGQTANVGEPEEESDEDEEEADGTVVLQNQLSELMEKCDEIVREVNAKGTDRGYGTMWKFDSKTYQLYFLENPQKPMLDALLAQAHQLLVLNKQYDTSSGSRMRHGEIDLPTAIRSTEETLQADKAARMQWYEHKKEYKIKTWKGSTDKCIELLQQQIAIQVQRERDALAQKQLEAVDGQAKVGHVNYEGSTISRRRVEARNGVEHATVTPSAQRGSGHQDGNDPEEISAKELEMEVKQSDADEHNIRDSMHTSEQEHDTWVARTEQARQILQKKNDIEALSKKVKELQEELGIDPHAIDAAGGLKPSDHDHAHGQDGSAVGSKAASNGVESSNALRNAASDGMAASVGTPQGHSNAGDMARGAKSSEADSKNADHKRQVSTGVSREREAVDHEKNVPSRGTVGSRGRGKPSPLQDVQGDSSHSRVPSRGRSTHGGSDQELDDHVNSISDRHVEVDGFSKLRDRRSHLRDGRGSPGRSSPSHMLAIQTPADDEPFSDVDSEYSKYADEEPWNESQAKAWQSTQKLMRNGTLGQTVVTDHDMPPSFDLGSQSQSRQSKKSRQSKNSVKTQKGVGFSENAESTQQSDAPRQRQLKQSTSNDQMVSSNWESEEWEASGSGTQSASSSEDAPLQEEPVSPTMSTMSKTSRSSLRRKSSKGQGTQDLNTVVKQAERSNAVLRRRREAKYSAFKRTLVKLGLHKEAEEVGAPEIASEKHARYEKEMQEHKEALKNLNRMVGFWETRINQREQILVDQTEKMDADPGGAAWAYDAADPDGAVDPVQRALAVAKSMAERQNKFVKRKSMSAMTNPRASTSYGQFQDGLPVPDQVIPGMPAMQNAGTYVHAFQPDIGSSSSKAFCQAEQELPPADLKQKYLETQSPEFDVHTSLVQQILMASKVKSSSEFDPVSLQGDLMKTIMQANVATKSFFGADAPAGALRPGQGELGLARYVGFGSAQRGSGGENAHRSTSPFESATEQGTSRPQFVQETRQTLQNNVSPIRQSLGIAVDAAVSRGTLMANKLAAMKRRTQAGSASESGNVMRAFVPANLKAPDLTNNRSGPLSQSEANFGQKKPRGYVAKQDRLEVVKFLDSLVQSGDAIDNLPLLEAARDVLDLYEYRPAKTGINERKSVFDLSSLTARPQGAEAVVDKESKRHLVEFLAKVANAKEPPDREPPELRVRRRRTLLLKSRRTSSERERRRSSAHDPEDDFGLDFSSERREIKAPRNARERAVVLLQMLSQRSGLADQIPEMDVAPTGFRGSGTNTRRGSILDERESRRTNIADIRAKRRSSISKGSKEPPGEGPSEFGDTLEGSAALRGWTKKDVSDMQALEAKLGDMSREEFLAWKADNPDLDAKGLFMKEQVSQQRSSGRAHMTSSSLETLFAMMHKDNAFISHRDKIMRSGPGKLQRIIPRGGGFRLPDGKNKSLALATLDSNFEDVVRKNKNRKNLAMLRFRKKFFGQDGQGDFTAEEKERALMRRGEEVPTDEEKRRKVLDRQRERRESVAERRRLTKRRSRPSLLGFKDTRSFIGIMEELDENGRPPGTSRREGDQDDSNQVSSQYQDVFSPDGNQRRTVEISQDMFDQLELSHQHLSLALLAAFREKIVAKYCGFRQAFHSLATAGAQKNKLTKLRFLQIITEMGFGADDAENLWRFIYSIHGTTKDLGNIAREMTCQEFVEGLKYAAPVKTLIQLRQRLITRYGQVKTAFDNWDKDHSGNLDFNEFCTLCMTVGCTAEASKQHFLKIVEHNTMEFEGVPQVTSDAFVMSLTHAEGLQVVQRLRQQVCSGWSSPYEAFAELDSEFFGEPLDLPDFRMAVSALGVSGNDAKHLFNLGMPDSRGRVKLEEVILRILGGLGAHHQRLAEAMRGHSAGGFQIGRARKQSTVAFQRLGFSEDSGSTSGGLGTRYASHRRSSRAASVARRLMERDMRQDRRGATRSGKTLRQCGTAELRFPSSDEDEEPPSVSRRRKSDGGRGKFLDFQSRTIHFVDADADEKSDGLRIRSVDKLRRFLDQQFQRRGHPLRYETLRYAGVTSDPLDCAEWIAMLRSLGVCVGDARRLFKLMDIAGDGTITREEFNVALTKFSHYDRHSNPRQRFLHLQRQLLHKLVPLQIVLAAEPIRKGITREELVLIFTGVGLPAQDAKDFFQMITGSFDKVAVPMYEIVRAAESVMKRSLMIDVSHQEVAPRDLSAMHHKHCVGRAKLEPLDNHPSEETGPLGAGLSQELFGTPRSQASKSLNEKTSASASSRAHVSKPHHSNQPSAKEGSRRASILPPPQATEAEATEAVSADDNVGSHSVAASNGTSSPTLKNFTKNVMMRNRFLNAAQREPLELDDVIQEPPDDFSPVGSETGSRVSFLSPLSTTIPSSPMSPHSEVSAPNLHLTDEEIQDLTMKETQLALKRFNAFNGSFLEFQIAIQHAQDLRKTLLTRNRCMHSALRSLAKEMKNERFAEGTIAFADFLSAMGRLKIASLDAERIFKVFELSEGRNPPTPKEFVSTMRFVAPVTSILMLRKRLVERYRSVDSALNVLRTGGPGGVIASSKISAMANDFSVDQFEKQMLCYAGVCERGARKLFRTLDIRQSGFLTWDDLAFGLEHAAAYSQLEGLGAHLLHSSKSIEGSLLRRHMIQKHDDLGGKLDANVLEHLGVHSSISAEVMKVLSRSAPASHGVTMETLVKQLQHINGGRGHESSGAKQQAQTGASNKKSKAGKGVVSEEGEDSVAVSDAQIAAAISAWRVARSKFVNRFPGGAVEAFNFLDVQKQGEVSFAEWVNRLRSIGLFEREEAVALFGLMIDWKHSHWIPGVRGSQNIKQDAFFKALRRSEPMPSLREVRARLIDELGSFPKAFEHIAGGPGLDITYDKWLKSLRNMWALQAEAAQSFALFDAGSDDRVSLGTFTRTLRQAEAAVKMQDVCQQLVHQHGIVSRAFESIDLARSFKQKDFVAAVSEVFQISARDCQALFPCLIPQMGGTVQMADFFDAMASLEEQRHRHLVPFTTEDVSKPRDEELAEEGHGAHSPIDEEDSEPMGKDPNRKYTVLPNLNLTSLPNSWSKPAPSQKAQTQRRQSVNPHMQTLDFDSAQRGSVHLPKLQSARGANESSSARRGSVMNTSSPHSARGKKPPSAEDAEADRLLRAQQWSKHPAIGQMIQRDARRKATGGKLDPGLLDSVKQALLSDTPGKGVKDKSSLSWLTQTNADSAKDLLT